ncbi:putative metallo-hydrolase YflN [Chlorella vulgaris]
MRAVKEVLRRWRLFYPDAPLLVINEGQDAALERAAQQHGAQHMYAPATSDTQTTIFTTADSAARWVQHLLDAGAAADWVLLLEDDVHLLKPISFHTLHFDINGDNKDVRLANTLTKVIERIRGTPLADRHFGGSGGAIFRGSFLRQLARSDWQSWLEQLLLAEDGVIISDQLITSLMHCINGTLGHYPGYAETWYTDFEARKAAGDIEVVHKEKSFYGNEEDLEKFLAEAQLECDDKTGECRLADSSKFLTQWWRPIPGLPSIPVAVYLVHQGAKWALVDAGLAGTPRQPHAHQLLAALKAAIPADQKLAAVIVTHAHPDHIGALPLLLAAYPEVQIVFHENEAPLLVGDEHLVAPGSVAARILRWVGMLGEQPIKASCCYFFAPMISAQRNCGNVPAARAVLLEEPILELSQVGLDDLVYIISFGHSRGHISLLHNPSRTVLAGDALSFVKPSLRLSSPEDANDTRVVGTWRLWAPLPDITLRAQPLTLCFDAGRRCKPCQRSIMSVYPAAAEQTAGDAGVAYDSQEEDDDIDDEYD